MQIKFISYNYPKVRFLWEDVVMEYIVIAKKLASDGFGIVLIKDIKY